MGAVLSISKAVALIGLHASEWALFIFGVVVVLGLFAEGEIAVVENEGIAQSGKIGDEQSGKDQRNPQQLEFGSTHFAINV